MHQSSCAIRDIGAQYSACLQIHIPKLYENEFFYTQITKTVNTENIPGMCDLTNHMRDLVTAENELVLSHGIELIRKMTRFNLHQFILQKSESPTHYASENRFERFCRIKFFDKPTQRKVFLTFQIKQTQAAVISPWSKNCNILSPNSSIDSTADSIYLGRIIRAFELGLNHIL